MQRAAFIGFQWTSHSVTSARSQAIYIHIYIYHASRQRSSSVDEYLLISWRATYDIIMVGGAVVGTGPDVFDNGQQIGSNDSPRRPIVFFRVCNKKLFLIGPLRINEEECRH